MLSDLSVRPRSTALAGRQIDLIINGSIAAVESVRFVRSLRRLGAEVHCHLSSGALQFITPMALEWASANPVRTGFEGLSSHLAMRDVCVVAPASASFLAKLYHGITDTAQVALATSYLGLRKPLFVLPCMHDSLRESPVVDDQLDKLRDRLRFLETRNEEGKHKFPAPDLLADEVSHLFNCADSDKGECLLTLGSTRGFIDDVRCITNTSTGSLGSLIAEELYRTGFKTHIVAGYAQRYPHTYTHLDIVNSNHEMIDCCLKAADAGCRFGVFVAAAIDFEPEKRQSGKLRSDQRSFTLELKQAPKVIAEVGIKLQHRIAFKLEPILHEKRVNEIAEDYLERYDLEAIVLNCIGELDAQTHRALFLTREAWRTGKPPQELIGKEQIAASIVSMMSTIK